MKATHDSKKKPIIKKREEKAVKNNNNNNNENDNKNTSPSQFPKMLEESKQSMMKLFSQIEDKIKVLEEKENRWNGINQTIEKHSSSAKQKIKLNVGGQVFATSKSTLLAFEGSFFSGMLASGKWEPDEGNYNY